MSETIDAKELEASLAKMPNVSGHPENCFCNCLHGCCGLSLMCCWYFPCQGFMYILSCLWAIFCRCCCPERTGRMPLMQYEDPPAKKQCGCHWSRMFLGCLRLRLLQTPPEKRGCCWHCCSRIQCWTWGFEYICGQARGSIIIMDSDLKNNFGEVFPYAESVVTSNRDDLVELVTGKADWVTKREGYVLNSPINDAFVNWTEVHPVIQNTMGDKHVAGKQLVAVALTDMWNRVKAMYHGDEQILNDLERICPGGRPDATDEIMQEGLCRVGFYLMTGGELTDEELVGALALSKSPFGFLPAWVNYLFCGGLCLRRWANSSMLLEKAFLRYPEYYEKVLLEGRKHGFNDVDSFRCIISLFSISYLPSAWKLVKETLTYVKEDKKTLWPIFKDQDPFRIVKEVARLFPPVHITSYGISKDHTFESGGQELTLHKGDVIGMHFAAANWLNPKDQETTPLKLDYNRDEQFTDLAFSFNDIEANYPKDDTEPAEQRPRACPGHNMAFYVAVFLVNQFASTDKVRFLQCYRDRQPAV